MSIDTREGFVGNTFKSHAQNGKAEEGANRSQRSAKIFSLLVAILILTASVIALTSSSPQDENSPASISYSKRGIINIVTDAGFNISNGVTSGTGVLGDPFIITGYEIDASPGHAISISGTRAYFEVSNCYLHNGSGNSWDGIIMTNVENGTIKNNVILNNSHGIHLDASNWNNLFHNNASLNSLDGIYFDSCHNDTVDNNTCWKNTWNGVFLSISYNNTLRNNTCISNSWDGIYLEASSTNMIEWNNCSWNLDDGVAMYWNCNSNQVFQNLITNNTNYGCEISHGIGPPPVVPTCFANVISENNFIFNNGAFTPVWTPFTIQGYDDAFGVVNFWNGFSGKGNYWNDWRTPDADSNGIVDSAYLLDPLLPGPPFYWSSDLLPLTNPGVLPIPIIPEPGIIFLAISMMAVCLLMIRKRRRE